MDLKRDMGLHREDRLATLAMAPKRAGWEGRGPRPQRSKGAPGGTRSRVSNHVCDEYHKVGREMQARLGGTRNGIGGQV